MAPSSRLMSDLLHIFCEVLSQLHHTVTVSLPTLQLSNVCTHPNTTHCTSHDYNTIKNLEIRDGVAVVYQVHNPCNHPFAAWPLHRPTP